MGKLILALILSLAPVLALAQGKVPLAVIHAQGDFAMNTAQIYEMIDYVQSKYAELGISFRIKRIRVTEDLFPQQGVSPFGYNGAIFAWENWARRKRIGRRHWLIYVVAPPVPDVGRLWFGGVALASCRKARPRLAYGNAGPVNISGLDRRLVSAVIMQHELGHLLGANHTEELPPTVMHPAPLGPVAFGGYIPPWAEISKQEIYQCRLFESVPAVQPDYCLLRSN